jgi:hypothetical protein
LLDAGCWIVEIAAFPRSRPPEKQDGVNLENNEISPKTWRLIGNAKRSSNIFLMANLSSSIVVYKQANHKPCVLPQPQREEVSCSKTTSKSPSEIWSKTKPIR